MRTIRYIKQETIHWGMTNIDISNPAYEHYRYNKARNFILLNVGE